MILIAIRARQETSLLGNPQEARKLKSKDPEVAGLLRVQGALQDVVIFVIVSFATSEMLFYHEEKRIVIGLAGTI